MIISSRDLHFKGFDDTFVKQQHFLQAQIKQRAPLTSDGGREILYWCQTCRTPWYEGGHQARHMHLSQAQLWELADHLLVDVTLPSALPHALCPDCAGRFFGGIPHIETYAGERGYRFSWERVKSPAWFLCCLYASPPSAGNEVIEEVLSHPTDVALLSKRIGEILQWLATLPDPEWYQVTPLSPEHCTLVSRFSVPASQLAWCGYSWQTFCPPLRAWIAVLLGLACTQASHYSESLLLECWRQIAKVMKSAL